MADPCTIQYFLNGGIYTLDEKEILRIPVGQTVMILCFYKPRYDKPSEDILTEVDPQENVILRRGAWLIGVKGIIGIEGTKEGSCNITIKEHDNWSDEDIVATFNVLFYRP